MGGMIQGVGTAWLGVEQGADDSRSVIRQGELEQATAAYNARQIERKGSLDAAKQRMEGSQLIARQKVAYANSGVATDTGTPLAVMSDTRSLTELDAMTTENDARRAAFGQRLIRDQSLENSETKLRGVKRQTYGSVLSGIGQFGSGAASAGSMGGGAASAGSMGGGAGGAGGGGGGGG